MLADADDFQRPLGDALAKWGLSVSPAQMGLLQAHFEAVLDANRTVNLTRITEPVEAAVKHYADSLALLWWSRERRIKVRTVLEIGSGAGYPAVPLAVMCPDWSVTAIDATAKKVNFLARVARQLMLTNLHVEHAHARHWPERRCFDVVVLRAVGRLAKCLDQATPHVAPEGRIVAYKTAHLEQDELRAAQGRSARLNLDPEDPFHYELQSKGETLCRTLHIYRRRQ